MYNSLRKYRAGLAVLGLITIALLVVVVLQSGNAKADKETDKQVEAIALKLNRYVDRRNSIPDSLEGAGVTEVSDAIRYEKISDERYRFCVTYKADSDGFDGASVAEDLFYGGLTGQSARDYSSDDAYEASTLYPPYYHKKGENCQTVKPYLYNSDSYFDDSYYN